MKIKMKSIHANIINETVSASATDVRAQIEIGYSHDEKNRLQLNYHISVGKQNSGHLYVIKCSFVLIDFSTEMSEKEILNEAVENLQERNEIILALLTEEMGFELLS